MKAALLILPFIILSFTCSAQDEEEQESFIPYQLTSFSGQVKARGVYREQETLKPDYYLMQKSLFASGGVLVNTNSFILHPSFLTLDLGGEYSPETSKEKYFIIPDFSEVRTLKRLDIRATFLQRKPLTLITFLNLNHSYNNRETLTDIKSFSRNWGGLLSYSNKLLPFTVNFQNSKREQLEIQTGRNFIYRHGNLEGRASKWIGKNSQNDISLSHRDYWRKYSDRLAVNNISDNINLNNAFFFNDQRTSRVNSAIHGTSQKGNDTYGKIQAFENIIYQLPYHLNFTGNYRYNNMVRKSQKLNQQNATAMLAHKLFQSLNTAASIEYNKTAHTAYSETNRKAGLDIRYAKKIPAKGHLTLTYRYYLQHQSRESKDIEMQILNEEYVLSDGQIVLLERPYVDPASVEITDGSGTIIYQVNLDYVLVERGNFLEIRRVPGGQIANNSPVYADYTAIQPGTYQYDINNHNLYGSISLFNRLVEIYYRAVIQNYANLQRTDYLVLNYIKQNVYGLRLQTKYTGGGVEYNDNNSSVLPYIMTRYYITMQGYAMGRKIQYILNANILNYRFMQDNSEQDISDFSCAIGYSVSPSIKMKVTAGYQKQNISRINLDLLTGNGEITADFKQLNLSFGVELYRRIIASEHVNFKGAYLTVVRKF